MACSVRTNILPEVPAIATSKDPYSTMNVVTTLKQMAHQAIRNDSLAEWERWNETRAKSRAWPEDVASPISFFFFFFFFFGPAKLYFAEYKPQGAREQHIQGQNKP